MLVDMDIVFYLYKSFQTSNVLSISIYMISTITRFSDNSIFIRKILPMQALQILKFSKKTQNIFNWLLKSLYWQIEQLQLVKRLEIVVKFGIYMLDQKNIDFQSRGICIMAN